MADERTLGLARAFETDEDATKEELQRRMEEARESISQTVTEIKDTVANQYNTVKETVSDALDWREQFRKRPIAWSAGALGVGIIVGYRIGGLVESESVTQRGPTVLTEGGGPSAFTEHHSYAAHERAVAAGPYGKSDSVASAAENERSDEALASRPSYSSGYAQSPVEENKPGLIDRFKETRAYDRLQEEVSDLGNRFMDELSNAARTIVLPALFTKLKEMVGVDLSTKREGNNQPGQRPSVSKASNPGVSATPTESGASLNTKAPAPKVNESRSKFDRLAGDNPPPAGESENSLPNNANYDDRYERESKLYARGENRGFGARVQSESKTATSEKRSTDPVDTPRGANYTYEPEQSSGSAES